MLQNARGLYLSRQESENIYLFTNYIQVFIDLGKRVAHTRGYCLDSTLRLYLSSLNAVSARDNFNFHIWKLKERSCLAHLKIQISFRRETTSAKGRKVQATKWLTQMLKIQSRQCPNKAGR